MTDSSASSVPRRPTRQTALFSERVVTGKEDRVGFWLTPPDVMKALDQRFHFTFDPCPYPRPLGFDGLKEPWGPMNWVNPPFDKGSSDGHSTSCTAWIRKAIAELEKGRSSVVILPVPRWMTRAVTAGVRLEVPPVFRWLNTRGEPQKAPRPQMLFVFEKPAKPCEHCGGTGRAA